MNIRIEPFGNHPDGGKISELKEGEPIPDYMMPISSKAQEILNSVSQHERVNFVLQSNDPNLQQEKEWLTNHLRKIHERELMQRLHK